MANARKQYFDNSIQLPIYQTATYWFQNTADIVAYHEGKNPIGRYARYDSPNCIEVEEELASLDRAESALVFTSGMTAISTIALALSRPGDKVLYTGRGYRNIRTFFSEVLSGFDVEAVPLAFFDGESAYEALARQMDKRCKILFLESPSNPHMYLADVRRIRQMVGDDVVIIVDSTFATPINYRPLEHGANLVVQSCGKYLAGHADLMAGAVAGEARLIEKIRKIRNVTGGILDPHSAFMLTRSLTTLALRMENLNQKGAFVASALNKLPGISKVFHTSLPMHPSYKLAREVLTGNGAVITFAVDGSLALTSRFVDETTVPYMGTNFGSHLSMIEQLRVFTYYKNSDEECSDLGISDSLVRLSVGFKDKGEAIVEDIERALARASPPAMAAHKRKAHAV